jgi:hypothetical protein
MDIQLKNRHDLKARALLLGDRLDLKLFKIADCLATTPLTLEVDARMALRFYSYTQSKTGQKSLTQLRFSYATSNPSRTF